MNERWSWSRKGKLGFFRDISMFLPSQPLRTYLLIQIIIFFLEFRSTLWNTLRRTRPTMHLRPRPTIHPQARPNTHPQVRPRPIYEKDNDPRCIHNYDHDPRCIHYHDHDAVGGSVMISLFDLLLLGATYAVYTALFLSRNASLYSYRRTN